MTDKIVIPTNIVINFVPWAAASPADKAEVVREVLRAINVWLYTREEETPVEN